MDPVGIFQVRATFFFYFVVLCNKRNDHALYMRAPKLTGGKLPEMFKVLLKPSGHLHQLLILILVLSTSLNSQNEVGVQLCYFFI